MAKLTIPFSTLPYEVIEKISHPFIGLGSGLAKVLPYLEMELIQAKFDVDPKKYASVMIFLGLVYFLFFFGFYQIQQI